MSVGGIVLHKWVPLKGLDSDLTGFDGSAVVQTLEKNQYRGGHGRKVEGLLHHQLPQDVNGVQVPSLRCILLQSLDVLPVLQRHSDLQEKNRAGTWAGAPGRSPVCYLLSGFGRLAAVQAVEQVESPDPDLEAERGQEEAAGRVQNQTGEHSALAPPQTTENTHNTHSQQRSHSLINAKPTMCDIRLTGTSGRTSSVSIFRRRFRSGPTLIAGTGSKAPRSPTSPVSDKSSCYCFKCRTTGHVKITETDKIQINAFLVKKKKKLKRQTGKMIKTRLSTV